MSYNKSLDEGYHSEESFIKPKSSDSFLKEKFSISKLIQKSNIAQVYKGKCKSTKQPVIIKRSLNSAMSQDEIPLTIKANKIVSKYTLPTLFAASDNKYTIYVQPEFGVSILDFMTNRNKSLSVSEAKFIFKQILIALIKLQNAGIYHLDIKEENILIDPATYKIKIIDFGSASTKPINQITGTREFLAPEVLLQDFNKSSLSKHDVWSFAVTLFSATTGQFPYTSLKNVLLGKESIDLSTFGREYESMIEVFSFCMVLDYKDRCSFCDLLKLEFFN